jgi:hypothetical protein
MPDSDYVTVHEGVVTNTTPNSKAYVDIWADKTPICPNMTDKEFRVLAMKLRDHATALVAIRISALTKWSGAEQSRVYDWFGLSDNVTRMRLLEGLSAVNRVLLQLEPKNFIRSSEGGDRAVGCLPTATNRDQEAAHVCAPDTATHTISISEKFCVMRDWSAYADSKISTLIHEVTHFDDTMATVDHKYSIVPQLKDWGKARPNLAIENADSVAGYVVYGD